MGSNESKKDRERCLDNDDEGQGDLSGDPFSRRLLRFPSSF